MNSVAPAPTVDSEIRLIRHSEIDPSPTNPRTQFDGLIELAKSIGAMGILQPALLRPVGDRYECVFGERRRRASIVAGQEFFRAEVRTLSNEQVVFFQTVENDQRQDVPPWEEAESYRRLLAFGYSQEDIGNKIGRSARYVSERLWLASLVAPIADDLRSGRLPFGHAHTLARLDPDIQRSIHDGTEGFALYEISGSPISLKLLKRAIQKGFFKSLTGLWPLDDAALVPEAGSCDACPKRLGNQPSLLDILPDEEAGKRQEWCTSPGCYAKKQTAFVELVVDRIAKANGIEPRRVSSTYGGDGRRDVATMAEYAIVREEDDNGGPAIETAVVVHGDSLGQVLRIRMRPGSERPHDAEAERERVERRHRKNVWRATAAKACKAARATAYLLYESSDRRNLLSAIAKELTAVVGNKGEQLRTIAESRALTTKGAGPVAAIQRHLSTIDADEEESLALVVELLVARRATLRSESIGEIDADEGGFWEAVGVDWAKLEREAEVELAEKEAAATRAS